MWRRRFRDWESKRTLLRNEEMYRNVGYLGTNKVKELEIMELPIQLAMEN